MVTNLDSGRNLPTTTASDLEKSIVHPSDQAHHVEHRLRHHLMNHPDFEFSELVIHRMPNGVCLEGRLHVCRDAPDLNAEIFRILGRCQVVNRVVLCEELRTDAPPERSRPAPRG